MATAVMATAVTWQFVERASVRRLPGGGFIGEGRTHATFAVGEITDTPEAALHSAAAALTAIVAPKQTPIASHMDDLL